MKNKKNLECFGVKAKIQKKNDSSKKGTEKKYTSDDLFKDVLFFWEELKLNRNIEKFQENTQPCVDVYIEGLELIA